jgi:hypothetical protein
MAQFVSRATADCCQALWHRVGGRVFTWSEVKGLLGSPSQLRSMRNRGYVKEVGEIHGLHPNHNPKLWQLTAQAQSLANVRERMWA